MINEEYLKNFGKKYYLIMVGVVNGKEQTVVLYKGTLRSILKYTTYKDNSKNFSINDEESLKRILSFNLSNDKNVFVRDILKKFKFYMSSDKAGKNKMQLKYSDSRDLLFCESFEIIEKIRPYLLTTSELDNPPKKKMELLKFVCRLIDEDYQSKLKEDRDSHNKTTDLDILRKCVGSAIIDYKLTKVNFEKVVGYDYNSCLTAIELICKDIVKKEKLINKVKEITGLKEIITDSEASKKSRRLTYSLKQNNESRKFIEGSIYNSLINYGLLQRKVEKNPVKKVEPKNLTPDQIYLEEKRKDEFQEDYDDDEIKDILEELKNATSDEVRERFLKRYNERTYELYLLQEGIPLNDNGDPMYELDYDNESKSL